MFMNGTPPKTIINQYTQSNKETTNQLQKCFNSMEKGEIPQQFPTVEDTRNNMCFLVGKHNMCTLVDLNWTKTLAAKIGELICLEVCGGNGWLAKALKHFDVDITCTNLPTGKVGTPVTEVLRRDCVEAIKEFNFNCLILSWPPDHLIKGILEALKPGTQIIFFGSSKNFSMGASTEAILEHDSIEILSEEYLPSSISYFVTKMYFLKTKEKEEEPISHEVLLQIIDKK